MATPESSPTPPDADSYKAKLKSLSFGSVPGGTRQGRAKLRPKQASNSWEAGVKGERRVDGSFMPYIDQDMNPIRMKQWSENRHAYEAQVTELRKPAED